MKKYTEFEKARDAYKERLHHTIEHQIAKMESTIEVLLDGVDMTELTSKDRFSIAARFISLHQRAILQQQLLDATSNDNDATLTLLSIARIMGGELDTEKEEFHVMETELAAYPENKDNHKDDLKRGEDGGKWATPIVDSAIIPPPPLYREEGWF